MSNVAALVASLQDLAQVETSEGFTNTQLSNYVTGALQQHNPKLTFATLPAVEEECVVTLAWVKLTLIRASRVAKDSNLSGAGGYGQDRKTPFDKLMSFAVVLKKRYIELCEAAEIENDAGSIVVGQLLVRDQLWDCLVPLFASEDVPDILLGVDNPADTSSNFFILHWNMKNFANFYTFYVLALSGAGTDSLYQAWNNTSATGINCINDAAMVVYSTQVSGLRAFKMTGLDKTQQIRFLIAVRTGSNGFGYSNELIWNPISNTFSTGIVNSDTVLPAVEIPIISQVITQTTPPDVISNPNLAGSIWMLPGQQPTLYVWNSTLSQWINVVDGASYAP